MLDWLLIIGVICVCTTLALLLLVKIAPVWEDWDSDDWED